MDKNVEKAVREMADAFRQFSRNGRWGTCAGCPRDTFNNAFPEFCEDTTRYDHLLGINELADSFKIRLK